MALRETVKSPKTERDRQTTSERPTGRKTDSIQAHEIFRFWPDARCWTSASFRCRAVFGRFGSEADIGCDGSHTLLDSW